MGKMLLCLGFTSGFCMNDCYTILFPFLYNFLPVCLCLAVSVLNQSSPMMNVKKECLKCTVIHFHYILLLSTGGEGAVESFDWFSTSVFCSFIYITTSFSQHIVQYHLILRGQSENIALPCFVTCVEVWWCRDPQFFILSTFNVTVERAFVSHRLFLNDVCCEKNKCIRSCLTFWALSYHIVWHSQCTELKALTMP